MEIHNLILLNTIAISSQIDINTARCSQHNGKRNDQRFRAGDDESQSDDDTFCTATSFLTSDSSDHHMINVAYLFNKIARQQSKGREVDIDKSYRRAKSNPVPSKRRSINKGVPMHISKSLRDHRQQSSLGDEADVGDTSTVTSHSDRSWSSYEEKSASQDKVILKLAVRVNKSEEKVQKLTNKLNKHTMRIQQLEKEIGDLKLASVGLSAHH